MNLLQVVGASRNCLPHQGEFAKVALRSSIAMTQIAISHQHFELGIKQKRLKRIVRPKTHHPSPSRAGNQRKKDIVNVHDDSGF